MTSTAWCTRLVGALVLLVSLGAATPARADDAAATRFVVQPGGATLHARPHPGSKQLAKLPPDAVLELVSAPKSEGWLQVRAGKQVGYVSLTRVAPQTAPAPPPSLEGLLTRAITTFTSWKGYQFWITLAILLFIVAVFSVSNRYFDGYLRSKYGEYLSYKFYYGFCIATGIIIAIFFLIWDEDVLHYYLNFPLSPPFWDGTLEFLLFMAIASLTLVTIIHLIKDLRRAGLGFGLLHHLAGILCGVLWGGTALFAAIGVLVPALILFGGLAYLRALLDPSEGPAQESSGPSYVNHSEQAARDARQRQVERAVYEAHDMRSRGYEQTMLGGWKKKDE